MVNLEMVKNILIVCSGACFLLGSIYLAKSIKWQSEELSRDDNSEFAKNVRQMGSPGRTDYKNFRIGIVLNGLGYSLLVISTIINP